MSRLSLASWPAALAVATLILLIGATQASAEPRPTSTEPKSGAGTATAAAPATLVAVRVATHDTYDRVVFEYSNGVPAYEVAYGPVTEPGSGQGVELRGEQSLELITRNTTGVRGGPLEGTTTDWTFQFPSVVQVNHLGSFEGTGETGIGVATASPVGFRVATLSDPARLVIDVAHAVTSTPGEDPTAEPTSGGAQPQEGPQPPGDTPPSAGTQPQDGAQHGDAVSTPQTSQTSKGVVAAGSGGAAGGGTADSGVAGWRLGLIGGIAAVSLAAAALIIRKITSGAVG